MKKIKILLGATLVLGISSPIMYDSYHNLNNVQAHGHYCNFFSDSINTLKKNIEYETEQLNAVKDKPGYEDEIEYRKSQISIAQDLIKEAKSNMDDCNDNNISNQQPQKNQQLQQPQKNLQPIRQHQQPKQHSSYVKKPKVKILPKSGMETFSLYAVIGLLLSSFGFKYAVKRLDK